MKNSAKVQLQRQAKKMGLRVKGNFLIAVHTADVVSGIAIDAPPSSIYLWTFVLPTYDDLSFLHMSYGHRVATCAGSEYCLSEAYDVYSKRIRGVETAKDLVAYLDAENIQGDNGMWVRLISHVRSGDLLAAESALQKLSAMPMHKETERKLSVLETSLSGGGLLAAQDVLEGWERSSAKLFDS
jgi:hypothetical protein